MKKRYSLLRLLCFVIFVFSVLELMHYSISSFLQYSENKRVNRELRDMRQEAEQTEKAASAGRKLGKSDLPAAGIAAVFAEMCEEGAEKASRAEMLPRYRELYESNQDLAGWLTIDGTEIDYPVMQTLWDEDYYLQLDFYRQENKNGCLILDTDSNAGTGTKSSGYTDGTAPSTNLIIHGHTMKSGEMFGKLKRYADAEYGAAHSIICFDSLYEERKYELIAVFYSRIYYESDEVFKYYEFFQADTREEFADWYENIKELSLYDTGVTAQPDDQFITLSCCSYHVEDGRFVVIGKRVE